MARIGRPRLNLVCGSYSAGMDDAPPGKNFHTDVTVTDRITVLSVGGELDISTVADLASVAHPAAGAVDAGLVVDLTDVRFLSSSAITELVRTYAHLPSGAVMALVATDGVVTRPVRLSGIDRLMSTFADLSAAIAHIEDLTKAAHA
jgi:anti-sigma B factor antagonist